MSWLWCLAACMKQVRQIQDKKQRRAERQREVGMAGSPDKEGTSLRVLHAREGSCQMRTRALLRRSRSQKKTGCYCSCFSQNLPMNMKRLAWFNSCYYEAVGVDMALTHGSTGWGKRKTKQTTKLTLKERQTERGKEQEQGRAWPGSLLVQRTPVPLVHLLMWRLLIPTAGAGVEGCGRKRVSASTLGW